MFSKIAAPLMGVCLLVAAPVQAQTLAQALAQAWSRHPQAAAVQSTQLAAQARTEMASSLTPAPASLSLSTLDDQLGANRGKQEWELEVETPLWLPGQRHAAQVEAQAVLSELDAQQRLLRLQLAAEVREAWWAVAEARSSHALIAARNQAAKALLQDVERRMRAGELARMDLNLAQIEQLSSQSELDEAQAHLQQTEQNFLLLTGEPAPQAQPPESLSQAAPSPEAHPEVQAATAGKHLAQAKLALAESSQREAPTLAIRMVRDRSDFSDNYADAFGIKLTIPFSMGARVRQDLASNRADLVKAQAEYDQSLRRNQLAMDAGERQLKINQLQLERATHRAALTKDNLTLAEKSFALGESDLPSLLRARAAHFDAQAMLQRQQINTYAAVSRFHQSLGVLP